MGTNFTDFETTAPLVAATLNDRLDELDAALGSLPAVIDVTVTAGEDIAAREAVYISTGAESGETPGTPGSAYLAHSGSRATSSMAWLVGIATEAIASGDSGNVRLVGVASGFSGLTPGAVQYLSGTPGALSATASGYGVVVGIALSATEVLVLSRGAQQQSVASLARRATGLAGFGPPNYNGGSISVF